MDNQQYNQTAFQAEEPLLDSTSDSSISKKKTFFRSPIGVLVIVGGILVLILLILLVILAKQPEEDKIVENTVTVTPTIVIERNAVDQLFDELEEDLELADPTSNILPLPPVALELFISE